MLDHCRIVSVQTTAGQTMAVKLTDGGHLAKMADGRIIRFDKSGEPVETLRPGDDRYGFWLGLLYPFESNRGLPE